MWRMVLHNNMKKEEDIYVDKPWKDINEYFKLTQKYKLFGGELAKFLKKKKK